MSNQKWLIGPATAPSALGFLMKALSRAFALNTSNTVKKNLKDPIALTRYQNATYAAQSPMVF